MIANGWLMAYHGGHNTSLSCYNYKTNELRVFEAEKICGHKHLNHSDEYDSTRWANIAEELSHAMTANGVPLEFEHVCGGLPEHASNFRFHIEREDLKHFGITCNTIAPYPGHHWCHAYTNVMFTQYDRAIIWAFDAMGDDGPNQFYSLDRYGEQMVKHINVYQPNWDGWNEQWFAGNPDPDYKKRKILGTNLGANYWRYGSFLLSKISRNTQYTYDLPGKIMGAAAFGDGSFDPYALTEEYLREFDQINYSQRRNQILYKQRVKTPYAGNNWMGSQFTNTKDFTFQEECNRSQFIQTMFENCVIERLESTDMIRRIRENDNILLMSGGCALNVVMNQKLQDKYGIKVEVTPVPNDIGLSAGMVMRYAFENNLISRDTRVDPTYAGPFVSDNNFWHRREKVTFTDEIEHHKTNYEGCYTTGDVRDVAQLLREGNIIGMIQGPAECGMRALGARSILCDASFPDMKDKINKVKRREPYRPFAPMCKVEDAEKYFESPYYDNLAHMNINVTVRPEYRDQLKSITHVDGTARLQTVDKQHRIIYGLLDAHGGVLLNTSFNIAGKPILNTYMEAFKILETSEMDYLVVLDHPKRQYVIFRPKFKYGY